MFVAVTMACDVNAKRTISWCRKETGVRPRTPMYAVSLIISYLIARSVLAYMYFVVK